MPHRGRVTRGWAIMTGADWSERHSQELNDINNVTGAAYKAFYSDTGSFLIPVAKYVKELALNVSSRANVRCFWIAFLLYCC